VVCALVVEHEFIEQLAEWTLGDSREVEHLESRWLRLRSHRIVWTSS
jgi:hypothetical protein